MAAIYFLIVITCFVQIVFYLAIYSRFLKLDDQPPKVNIESCKPVSIVICAKNEARNLQKYLPVVLEQYYPIYEVIVIDDGSLDNTPKILAGFESTYPHLLTFRIEPEHEKHSGKKQALQHGVSLAKYDWILVPDGDCYPGSNHWAYWMTRPLSEGKDIVLGVSPYYGRKGFVNAFFRSEALFVAMQYLGFTLSGMPFMGVGRNMCYKREVFEQHDMSEHWDLVSGDDDLFVNDVSTAADVGICYYKDAYTYSDAPLTLKKWFRQKLRHYSAGHRYNMLQKVWLGYYWLSSILLYALIPLVIILHLTGRGLNVLLLIALFTTTLIRWVVTGLNLRKLGLHNFSWSVPIFDLAYILSVWVISPLAGLVKKRWK